MNRPSDFAASAPRPRAAGPRGSGDAWSTRLEQRYGLTLTAELRAWFDEEVWRQPGWGEFRHAVSPEVLLGDAPESIWPPLMPPFFLPLISNQAGDWLCLRLSGFPERPAGSRQTAVQPAACRTDICHWYHGGGDWLPWGDGLAEAILFDGVLPRLPGAGRRHAEPAEAVKPPAVVWQDHPWTRWLVRFLPGPDADVVMQTVQSITQPNHVDGLHLADQLCRAGWCEVAVRCQSIIAELANSLSERATPTMAAQFGVPWNEWMRWCFDLRELPAGIRDGILQAADWSPAMLDPAQQDWEAVECHLRRVVALSPDLAWGHDLLGYVHHRRGDGMFAAKHFRDGLRCSVFTDQSVRLRTHWATSGDQRPAKFAALFWGPGSDERRATEIDTSLDSGVIDGEVELDSVHRLPLDFSCHEYVRQLTAECGTPVRERMTRFFSDAAQDHLTQSRFDRAVAYWMAAGWDLGAEPMTAYADLLTRLVDACGRAGWPAHAAIAQTHRRCLQTRYGI